MGAVDQAGQERTIYYVVQVDLILKILAYVRRCGYYYVLTSVGPSTKDLPNMYVREPPFLFLLILTYVMFPMIGIKCQRPRDI